MLTAIFWKKIWTWLKHYWYWPVILILLAISMLSGKASREKLFNLLDKQKKNYATISEKYVNEIKKIEEDHNLKVQDLEEEKQKELVETLEKNKNKPENLAKEIAKILSASYHEKNR